MGTTLWFCSTVDYVLACLDTLSLKLRFTLEVENSNQISISNLSLVKVNNKPGKSIYRKPTASNKTIHSPYFHRYSKNIAAYNFIINWTKRIYLNLQRWRGRIFNCLKLCLHGSLNDGFIFNRITLFYIRKNCNSIRWVTPKWFRTKCEIGIKHSKHAARSENRWRRIMCAWR